jgi:alpha-aminoadipic semialdehyde synthase
MGITDISADFQGSSEITRHFLTIEDPYRLYDIKTKKHKELNEYQNGDILYTCIDHLPSELPYESSCHFGDKLFPFLADLARSDATKPFD